MNTVQIILYVLALSETTKLGLRQIYPSQTLHKENYEKGMFDLVKKLHPANLTPHSFGGPNHCSVVIPELGAAMKVIPLPIIKHRRFTYKILFKFDRRLFTVN